MFECYASYIFVIHALLVVYIQGYGFLDLEELQTSLYSVEISDNPISFSKVILDSYS